MPFKDTKIKLVFLLIINIIVWFIYLYSFIQIKMGDIRMLALENAMKENLRKQRVVMILSKNLSDTYENSQKLSDIFVKKDGEVDFIRSIEEIVSKYNLKSEIKNVEINRIASSTVLENISISLDVTGEWPNILTFQKLLEDIPMAIVLDSFSFKKFDTYNIKGKLVSQWVGSFNFNIAKIK